MKKKKPIKRKTKKKSKAKHRNIIHLCISVISLLK